MTGQMLVASHCGDPEDSMVIPSTVRMIPVRRLVARCGVTPNYAPCWDAALLGLVRTGGAAGRYHDDKEVLR